MTIGESAVDLFAGPGGWDLAARELGIDVVGIEFDHAACETRRAAGLETIEDDVRGNGPAIWVRLVRAGKPVFDNAHNGLIASPPCQTFSTAGKGAGRKALDKVLLGIERLAAGRSLPVYDDERTALVLEPLRWTLEAHRSGAPYEWLAFEQVPTVLPVWEAMAEVIRELGYNVATGILNAEQYGVPQTRRRAILIAHRSHEVALPTPTHSRYYSRNPEKLDEGVAKWVSMAEALGSTPGDMVRSNYGSGGDASNRGERLVDEPSSTITSKAGRNQWVFQGNQKPNRADGNYQQRRSDLPAPTVTSGTNYAKWIFTTNHLRLNATERAESEPAPTITGGHDHGERRWKWEHTPSTTICGDPRITAREHHNHGEQNSTSYRVTLEEAATLQSFPDGFPWRGNKGQRFLQVGNAIPPLLASVVLKAVLGIEDCKSESEAAA